LVVEALKSGNEELLRYIVSLVPLDYESEWDELIGEELKSGNRKLFDDLISSGAVNFLKWDYLAGNTILSGNKDLFDYIWSLSPENHDWDMLASSALSFGNKELFDYVRSLASPDYNWNWRYLIYIPRNEELRSYIRSLAANSQVIPSTSSGGLLAMLDPQRAQLFQLI
jgi:hypothetical protein